MGKRVTFLVLGAVMMLALLLSFGSPAAWAVGTVGISTNSGGRCFPLDEDGNQVSVSGSVHVVITQSANCNVNATCKTEIERDPGPAVTWNKDKDPQHRDCRINFDTTDVFTDQWQETVKPNGDVSMSCHWRGGCPPE